MLNSTDNPDVLGILAVGTAFATPACIKGLALVAGTFYLPISVRILVH
jgi:hypothetical protein